MDAGIDQQLVKYSNIENLFLKIPFCTENQH